jgi:hypothetical protein
VKHHSGRSFARSPRHRVHVEATSMPSAGVSSVLYK